jgi:hypothetical protein
MEGWVASVLRSYRDYRDLFDDFYYWSSLVRHEAGTGRMYGQELGHGVSGRGLPAQPVSRGRWLRAG